MAQLKDTRNVVMEDDRNNKPEATIFQKVQVIANHLDDALTSHAAIRDILFGEGESDLKESEHPHNLSALVTELCAKASRLATEAKTILARL